MRPILHGLCTYTALLDGSLDLGDIVRMNDALDVKFENEARAAEAVRPD